MGALILLRITFHCAKFTSSEVIREQRRMLNITGMCNFHYYWVKTNNVSGPSPQFLLSEAYCVAMPLYRRVVYLHTGIYQLHASQCIYTFIIRKQTFKLS
jgi:hypothetical protein